MKIHHAFLAGVLLFHNVNAAEPEIDFYTLGLRHLQSYAIVATGKFVITEGMEPDNGIGLASDWWELEFLPSEIFVDSTTRDHNEPIFIRVGNDMLPFLDWGISRGEATNFRESLQVERRTALMAERDALILAFEAQTLDALEYERRQQELEQALVATFEKNYVRVGVEPNHQFSAIKDVSIFPDEEYLVFLTLNHVVPGTFSLGGYNQGLFRGEEKYPVLRFLEEMGNLER